MDYSLIVFDWDGTLMDSTPTIVAAIQGACRDLGLPVPPDQAAAWVIGLSLQDAVQRAVPTLTQADVPRFVERYRFHYLTRDPQLRLFDGALAMLEELSALPVQLAVATGKTRIGLDRVLRSHDLGRFFRATRCADESFSKPHPAMLHELMRELDVPPERTVMIGDTSHDLMMARSAGTAAVGVTYGAHPLAELKACEPITIVDSVKDLHTWLRPRVAVHAA